MRLKHVGLITPPLPFSIPSHRRRTESSDKLIALEVNHGLGGYAAPPLSVLGLNSFTVPESLHVFLFSRSVTNVVF